jgi:hypothetical protein
MWQAETGAEFSDFHPACPTAHRRCCGEKAGWNKPLRGWHSAFRRHNVAGFLTVPLQ